MKVQAEFKFKIGVWKELRQPFIKKRHWNEIFKLFKRPQMLYDKTFTLKELMELRVDEKYSEIRYIMQQAKREFKYEVLLKNVEHPYESLKIKVIKFKEVDGK